MKSEKSVSYPILVLWLIGCMLTVSNATDVSGVPINKIDSHGKPVLLGDEIKTDPDKFIGMMKEYLRYGDTRNLGVLSTHLRQIQPDNREIRAMHSIYLISGGDFPAAREELGQEIVAGNENQFALYAESMILQHEGRFSEALNACEKAIAMDMNHPYPWNIKGGIYFELGKYDEAAASYRKAVELVPDLLMGHVNLGFTYAYMGDYQQAETCFEKAIELDPDGHRAYIGLALVHERLGNRVLAIEELEKSLKSKPDNPEAMKKKAELLLIAGRYEDAYETGKRMEEAGLKDACVTLGMSSLYLGNPIEAVGYLDKCVADTAAVDYFMGLSLISQGEYERALGRMNEALTKDSGHFGAYVARATLKPYLGVAIDPEQELVNHWDESSGRILGLIAGGIFASQGNWVRAEESWHSAEGAFKGFSIDGVDQDTLAKGMDEKEFKYINLGLVYYFANLLDNAFAEFEKAEKVNNDSILGNYWAALVSLKRGKTGEAEKFLKRSVKNAPTFFSALYGLGDLNSINNNENAVKYYERALAVRVDANLLIKLGNIYEETGEYDKATEKSEALIELYPNHFLGYNQLAWLYATRGIELDKAMKLARKAETLKPGNAGVLDTIGWIYYQLKQYDKAIGSFKKAIEIDSDNPTICYHLAVSYYADGEKDLAKVYLEKALRISDTFREVNEARKLLGEASY